MADVVTLLTQLAALQDIRASGVQSARTGDNEVSYRSEKDLAAAISDLERRIAAAQGQTINRVRFNTSKGL